jgi:hypothetical protein
LGSSGVDDHGIVRKPAETGHGDGDIAELTSEDPSPCHRHHILPLLAKGFIDHAEASIEA